MYIYPTNSQALSNQSTVKRWKLAKVLLVDEISMMSAGFFEALNELGKRIRNSNKPMGGLQVIFCGDFFQVYHTHTQASSKILFIKYMYIFP